MPVPAVLRLALATGLATLLAGLAVLTAPTAYAARARLTAAYVEASTWSTGYGGGYTVTNVGDAVAEGWTVEFDLPAGSRVTSSWSSVRSQTGQRYRFTNATWNGSLAPGASADFGFNVSGLGRPTSCLVNGQPCDGAPTTPSPTAAPSPTDPPSPTVPPSPTAPPSPTPTPSSSPGPTVAVATATELRAALADAAPGQRIQLAPGTYRGSFVAQRPGTAAAPIVLTGPRDAVLINDGPSGTGPSCPVPTAGWDSGYGLWLFAAAYWRLEGFTVAESKKGIVLDNAPHVTIDDVYVHHVEDEAVHFRRSSSDGILRNSRIEHTGLVQPGYGEAVYLGSANSNWSCHGNIDGVDRSDRVQVLGNRLGPSVAAEHIDVKEGTVGGVIRGNTFDGRGLSGQNSADSWVDMKGTGYVVEDNIGSYAPPGTFANGYETHNPVAGSGCGNIWRRNSSDLGGVGQWAINVTSTSKCAGNLNVVYASNTVTNATGGLTNIAVIP
ncbi:cellulose binding domain-containing protein [Plantactinospora solaniradicis]|uniref:Cellulose binding domain-containing protein n=1 Tax=Plantactinospora solaniradicis TaxID=1723736 RepID=A0ABW1KJN6_9ACTN